MNAILPDRPSRWAMAVAVATWVGILAAESPIRLGLMMTLGGLVVAATARRMPLPAATVAAFCILGVVSGTVAAHRTAALETIELPSGTARIGLRVAEDAAASSFGLAVGEITSLDGRPWNGPRVGLIDLPGGITVGWSLDVDAKIAPGVRRVRDEMVAGVVHIENVRASHRSGNPIVSVGNAVRGSVADRYSGSRRSDGLLSGFLTGDTDQMSASDLESLRLAGLSHFVAVSGSNVALFLAMWWLVTAPLSIHRRLRVGMGVTGLLLFSVITRWEPSVVRACVMAATVLVAGSVGVPIGPWTALGVAVTALLLSSGQLAFSVGFQLSVLATAGVLVGLGVARGREPRWLAVPLCSTIGAQLAVSPLLLVTFGTVPVVAPLTNLVAAPLIALTTGVAGLGVVIPVAAEAARLGAGLVQSIAEVASGGPQLGPVAFVALIGLGAAFSVPQLRVPLAAAIVVAAIALTPWSSPWPSTPELTVLDVGQGDAILIRTPDRQTLLMDGGANPQVLDRALRRNGVRRLDTVVVSHSDIDHAGGLVELVAEGRAGRLVVNRFAEPVALVDAARHSGVPVVWVEAGDRLDVGSVRIEVLSPARRFKSDNDGSIVLLVSGAVSVLLPGDIEAVAQRELPAVDVDVLVVPHHGSATTDPKWLARTVRGLAVLSYGPNRYGHPHPDIITVLDDSGAEIRRTPDGDVTVPLSSTTAHVTGER